LEITTRKGHCLGNGRLVDLARRAHAKLIINSDAHDPSDLYTADHYKKTALGAGLSPDEFDQIIDGVEGFINDKLEPLLIS